MAKATTVLPEWFESRSFTISILLHLALVLIAAFGLPAILPEKHDPVPTVITVEVLPISAMTNIKPSDQPITEKKEAPTPVKQPTPPVAQKVEPPKPVEKPVEKPAAKPADNAEKKPFDPNEGAEPKPADKQPPKPQDKPKEVPKKQEDDFLKTLNNLKAEAEKTTPKAKDTTTVPENKSKSDAPYDASQPLSISEQDAIRNQFTPCWSPPMGAKDAANLVVIVKAQFKDTGDVVDVELRDDLKGRYNTDPFFRAAADAAIRAVHRCTPLKNLDASKYGSWHDMEITFDPKAYN